MIGDLNLPCIDWINGTSSRKGESILDAVYYSSREQLVTWPTHNQGAMLDVVLARNNHSVYNIEDIGNVGNSDHTTILLDIRVPEDTAQKQMETRDWVKGDRDGLRNALNNVHWSNELNVGPEGVWRTFHKKVNELIDQYIPMKTCNLNPKPKWLTAKLKNASNVKRRLFKKYLQSWSQYDFDRYKQAEKNAKKVIRQGKRQFEKNLAEERDKSKFSRYVKTKISVKKILARSKLTTEYYMKMGKSVRY